MKNMKLLTVLLFLVLFSAARVGAETYNFSTNELFSLEHGNYYTWRIDWTIPAGETIDRASLVFEQLANNTPASNDLYIQLLPSVNTPFPVASYSDPDPDPGNYFVEGIELAHWKDLPNFLQNVTLGFDLYQIEQLTGYLSDGNFGFGFDPDCLYAPKITFMVETSTEVPIPGTVFLLTSGLIGIVTIRRNLFWKRNGR